jgi:hypothetical protein
MAAAYLRRRSPQDLCLDAAIVLFLSYLVTWTYYLLRPDRTDHSGIERALEAIAGIAGTMLMYIAIGLFIVGCIRIIADRIAPPPAP